MGSACSQISARSLSANSRVWTGAITLEMEDRRADVEHVHDMQRDSRHSASRAACRSAVKPGSDPSIPTTTGPVAPDARCHGGILGSRKWRQSRSRA